MSWRLQVDWSDSGTDVVQRAGASTMRSIRRTALTRTRLSRGTRRPRTSGSTTQNRPSCSATPARALRIPSCTRRVMHTRGSRREVRATDGWLLHQFSDPRLREVFNLVGFDTRYYGYTQGPRVGHFQSLEASTRSCFQMAPSQATDLRDRAGTSGRAPRRDRCSPRRTAVLLCRGELCGLSHRRLRHG